ncbi:MAG TPA: hypothetical protein VF294_08060 [Polyangiaceae bacterium]
MKRRARRVALPLVRVFAQRDNPALDLPELLNATRRFFDATLDVQSRSETGNHVELLLRCEKHGYEGRLSVSGRPVTESDLIDARAAEQRGRAAGMSSLAERCRTIWEVKSLGADSELARLNLCGILASVGLGPVLPDDGSTLFGVRGSMERVDRLLRSV